MQRCRGKEVQVQVICSGECAGAEMQKSWCRGAAVVQMCRGGAGAEVLSGGIRGGGGAEFMSLGRGGFVVVV